MRALIRAVLRQIAQVLFRVRVLGDMSHFQVDRLLIIANHESFLDGLLIGLFLPVDPVFVVHTGIVANPWFRLLLRGVDHLAVDPTNPMGMKHVVRLIESGRPVVIFPEGRITVTGSLMKVYDGPAFVAEKTQATIVPVRLDGPARSYFSRLSGRYPRRLLPRVTLTVLPPTRITVAPDGSAKLRRRAAGEAMRKLMQEMLFASRPDQTLFSALCDAIDIHGRHRRLVEDMRQIEYSYQDLLKMTLMLGRLVVRASGSNTPGERIGVLLPNLTATLGVLIGLTAQNRVPAMLNYTAGVDALQSACTAAEIR
ncbi:MAG: 1-acyl-sn-glycerol-3-phosphate acyltransferase, partial [Parasulfuritortus sp.]|nr:1-acyl-sn-glycerol-3-phosphate acyltransferase [Parasulfuritortus sp.]